MSKAGSVRRRWWLGLVFGALLALLALAGPAQASTVASFAYVANAGEGTVSVINTSTDAVVATVPVDHLPQRVAATPDGRYVYVTHQLNPRISVIDTSGNTIAGTFYGGGASSDVAFSPDGQRAYIPLQFPAALAVIDTATRSVSDLISVGSCAQEVALSPSGDRAYVANSCESSNSVSVIDTTTNTVVATVPTGNEPWSVAVSPNGTYVYATSGKGGVVIDPSTNAVTGSLPAGSLGDMAFSPDSSTAYILSGNLRMVNTATKTITGQVPIGTGTRDISLTPDGAKAYVPAQYSDNVTVIDTASKSVVATLPVGDQPIGVAITPPIEGPEYAPQDPGNGGGDDGKLATPGGQSSGPSPVPVTPKKQLKCRKGFKKRKVKGKQKCVKAKKHPRKKRRAHQ